MSIFILYESEEWSNIALNDYIRAKGIKSKLINLEKQVDVEEILQEISQEDLIINRVFASAQFRGHEKSLALAKSILPRIKKQDIEMINPYEAHFYEISKYRTVKKLSDLGILAPDIYCRFKGNRKPDFKNIKYPCVIKPDCGGRSYYTYIVEDKQELQSTLHKINDCQFNFIIQEYIKPTKGYTTRVEVIGNRCYSIMKRFIAKGGLASYNLGSKYESYENCSKNIKNTALKTMLELNIEMGSLDIIENDGSHYVIDVNSVSNFESQNIEEFGFNLIVDMSQYIVKRYQRL